MSAISKLKNTSFGSVPKQGLEVIDVYEQGRLDAFLANPDTAEGTKLVGELYPDLPADKVLKALNDPRTAEYLDKAGVTLKGALGAIDRNLPDGMDVGELMGDFDVPFLSEWGSQLKAAMPSDMFNGSNLDDFKELFGSIKKYNLEGYGAQAKQLWALWGKSSGVLGREISSTNPSVLAAIKTLTAKKLILSGESDKVLDWIEADENIPDDIKKQIYADLLDAAASVGNTDLIEELLNRAGSAATPAKRQATIKSMLFGYRLPGTFTEASLATEADGLITRCNILDANWAKTERHGVTVDSLKNFTYASQHALTVLAKDLRTSELAQAYIMFNPYKEKEVSLSNRFIYN